MNNKCTFFLFFLFSSTLLNSCDGIFHNIYDERENVSQNDYGFIKISDGENYGIIYVDATAYDRWTYIDLKNKKIDTTNILLEEEEPFEWDFALHRYDTKTHNGSVAESAYTSLEDLWAAGNINFNGFAPDINDSVMVDVSGMMEGIIRYAPSTKNPILSQWMDLNTSTMPPIYTLSNHIYILRMSDGKRAALHFVNYMNLASVKGFITIYYLYPY